MNQVANRAGTAVAALQGLKKGIANVKATLVKKGGDPFLKLGKDGIWYYGQEDTEVEAGSAWAINPLSIMHGMVAWKRGEDVDNSGGPVAEVMVPASLPMPTDLPDISHEQLAQWAQQFSFSMVCLTGEDKGEQVLYKTNSVGGIAVVDSILNAISAQLDDDPDNPVPVVVLDSDTYKHKKWGRTVTPIMDIKTWRPMSDDLPDVQAELDKQTGDETEPVKEEAKPARKRTASVPKTGGKAADADEDEELKALEEAIAKKKAEKDAKAAAQQGGGAEPDPEAEAKAKRRAELAAQLAAMDDDNSDGEAATPGSTQPMRRRRNA